ncbi:MAG: hypothetical protein HOB51_02290 [Thaumarchaeota archaeon]|mgnify:FL=1|nr:hypothetical protein [Nitrososphaerota archaeon]
MSSEKIPAFGSKGYQSMRNNDFNPEGAIAEVIDNSIQAESKNIKIKIFQSVPPGKQKPRINKIVFGDDGTGMDAKAIQYALQVGWSTRYNDRKGIGRFGVGMTYGAISVCEFVEIHSREKGGNWQYTFLDIEDREDNQQPGIEPIVEKSPSKEYQELAGDYGTIVVWKDIDRIGLDFDIDEFKHWLGRTYRKFIGERIIKNGKVVKNPNQRNIYIQINGEESEKINAFDPMYLIPEQFHILPENETSKFLEDITLEVDVSDIDAPTETIKKGRLTVSLSLTPKSWRPEARISGESTVNNARWVRDNEGISILRAGREVAYTRIESIAPERRTHDRFWSCEIDFEPSLDYLFSVKNMKVGARPIRELRDALKKLLSPKLAKLAKEISDDWTTETIKSHEGKTGSIGKHSKTEKTIGKISKPKKSELSIKEQKKRAEAFVKERKLKDEERKAFLEKILDPEGDPFLIEEDPNGRPDGPFIDIVPNLGKKVITYNMRHAFFKSIFDKLNEVEKLGKEVDPKDARLVTIANDLKDDIDYLIFAFADSRYDISGSRGEQEERIEDTLSDVELGWSDKLRRVYRRKDN